MASIIEFSTGRTPVLAKNATYVAPTVTVTYVAAESQAIADQLVLTNTKLRNLIIALQGIGVISES